MQLERVHKANQLLKRVLRVQMTVRKLRALEPSLGLEALAAVRRGDSSENVLQGADLRELSKAAQSLSEIEVTMLPSPFAPPHHCCCCLTHNPPSPSR